MILVLLNVESPLDIWVLRQDQLRPTAVDNLSITLKRQKSQKSFKSNRYTAVSLEITSCPVCL